MRTADIILDIPAQSFDAAFTYSIPEQLTELFVGCCVVVPLGHRRALGFVVSIDDHPATPEQWSDLVAYSRAQSKPFAAERTAVSDARFPNATLLDNRHANEQAVQQDLFADLLQAEDEPPIMEQTFVSRAQQDKLTASSASLSSSHGATPASAEELKELLEYFTNRQIIPHKLKSVISVETKSFFGSDQVRLARWMSQEYVAPLSSCIRLFVPAGALPKLVYQAGSWQLERPQTTPREDTWVRLLPAAQGFRPRKGAVKQQAILSALQEGALRTAELSYEYGAVSAALRSLEKHQVVEVFKKRSMRGDVSLFQSTAALHSLPTLTDEQQGAVDAIIQAQTRGQGEVLVVDGVTGSGKTEVYLRAIEHCLSQGKSAYVLVPEIALTPQTVARFRGRFGDTVALLHSKMSKGERLDQFDAIAKGEARVVIGARSALFAPLNHVGLIVIDEEHETSYKQDQSPRYDARRVAEYMMQDCGGVLVLGSATPRIESLYELEHNPRWSHLRLPNRVNASPLPPIEVVDMAKEFSRGGRSMFSRPLQAALLDMAHRGHKAVLLLNQRGFAQFLLCRDCGFVPRCPQCETSLTYHEEAGRLMCHHCGHQIAIPARCPKCTSPYLKRFGAGTQRLQAELEAFFTQHELTIPIVRMDADTTSTKGAHARLLDSFASHDSAVLLGTQMVAKGLDFPDVVTCRCNQR